jgi:hypothetical protein
MEALRLFTSGSASISFDEDRLGTFEVGKYADLAVLSADFRKVTDANLRTIKSVLTMVAGKIVHEGSGSRLRSDRHRVRVRDGAVSPTKRRRPRLRHHRGRSARRRVTLCEAGPEWPSMQGPTSHGGVLDRTANGSMFAAPPRRREHWRATSRAVSRMGTYVLHVSGCSTGRPAGSRWVGWTSSFRIRSQTRLVEAMIYR